jgi:hypothetical protein
MGFTNTSGATLDTATKVAISGSLNIATDPDGAGTGLQVNANGELKTVVTGSVQVAALTPTGSVAPLQANTAGALYVVQADQVTEFIMLQRLLLAEAKKTNEYLSFITDEEF